MPRTLHSLLYYVSFALIAAFLASPLGAVLAQVAEDEPSENAGPEEEDDWEDEALFDEDALFAEDEEESGPDVARGGEEDADAEADDEDLPLATAEEAESLLEEAAPDAPDMTRRRWTALKPVLTLHGYLRTRGEFQDGFSLGRTEARGVMNPGIPFERFTPASVDSSVVGGCTDDMGTATETGCFQDDDRFTYANMRLRLERL